jgi:hypothetical protein
MTVDPKLIDALQECLKCERTLADCFAGYHAQLAAMRIHRLERWMGWNAGASRKRCDALQLLICRSGALPGADRYEFELVAIGGDADGIGDVFGYFRTSLAEAVGAYRTAHAAAGDDGQAGAAHVCGSHQCEVEDTLQRIEAKINKVRLIGAATYIAHHMHEMG